MRNHALTHGPGSGSRLARPPDLQLTHCGPGVGELEEPLTFRPDLPRSPREPAYQHGPDDLPAIQRDPPVVRAPAGRAAGFLLGLRERSTILAMTSPVEVPSGIIRVAPFTAFMQRFEDLLASSS